MVYMRVINVIIFYHHINISMCVYLGLKLDFSNLMDWFQLIKYYEPRTVVYHARLIYGLIMMRCWLGWLVLEHITAWVYLAVAWQLALGLTHRLTHEHSCLCFENFSESNALQRQDFRSWKAKQAKQIQPSVMFLNGENPYRLNSRHGDVFFIFHKGKISEESCLANRGMLANYARSWTCSI